MVDPAVTSDGARARVVAAAGALLERGGRAAVSTRAVAAAAGVQAPTIYRLFGDKQGLLHAVAVDGLQRYLADKGARPSSPDPVDDLRVGWDEHVQLALRSPALYELLYDAQGPGGSPAAAAATEVLGALVHRIAETGRLRVPERRAVQLLQAACRGTAMTLLALPADERDPELSPTAREAVVAAITIPPGAAAPPSAHERLVGAAVTLRALAPHASVLSDGERRLLDEWLDRLARPER